ncbi:MAG: phosphate/phosphite/phosphonate ABC transporter substrate-binding protein [Candidatus Wallbacteria bacterium]|nr:phosphate/phosphite/phosphonate ABC transporter substrate-binding protein [Candidatus Wallbacteria bacterium]
MRRRDTDSNGLSTLLLAGLLALAPSLAGCEPVPRLDVRATTDEEAPFRLGVLPTDELPGLQRRYRLLVELLGERLKRPAEMVVSPDYDSLGALLGQGKIELAWFSGVSYLRARRKYKVVPIARAVLKGKGTYRGVLMVRTESAIRSIGDLKGKRFAYVDRDSGSGYLAANRSLVQSGISPLSDLASVAFTYNHLVSLQGVIEGRFDVAAVYENAVATYKGRLDGSKLRVLTRTEEVPKDVVAAATTVPAKACEQIWTLLEEIPRTAKGKAALKELERSNPIDGFVRLSPGSELR